MANLYNFNIDKFPFSATVNVFIFSKCVCVYTTNQDNKEQDFCPFDSMPSACRHYVTTKRLISQHPMGTLVYV